MTIISQKYAIYPQKFFLEFPLLFITGTLDTLIVVQHWYGVRYAQPANGATRWRAPVAYNGDLQHAINNRNPDAKQCPQGHGYDDKASEDCLYLDIFKPNNAVNLPIFIWVRKF